MSIREFEDGGKRDTSNGKFEYFGFRNPLCEHSFAAYMHGHRLMPNGEFRDSDNWWKGWGAKVSLQSLSRHVADLEALHAGLRVYKERIGDAEYTYYLQEHESPMPEWREVDKEETCNAIRFNSMAYLLETLKKRTPIVTRLERDYTRP